MKFYRKLSLIKQLYVLFIVIAVATIGTLSILYGVSFNIIRDRESQYMYNSVSQIAEKTTDITSSVDLIAETVAKASSAKHLLTEKNASQKWEYKQTLNNVIAEIAKSNTSINNILLLDNEGAVFAFSGFEYLLVNKLNAKYRIFASDSYLSGFSGMVQVSEQKTYYICIKPIFDTDSDKSKQEKIGSCLVVCETDALSKACNIAASTKASALMILDGDNQILASNTVLDADTELRLSEMKLPEEQLFPVHINGEKYLVCQHQPLSLTGWRVLSATPYREIYSGLRMFQTLAIIFVLVLLCGFYVLVRQTITNITRPLMKIVDFLQKGPYYTLHNHIEVHNHNEIDKVGDSINLMLDEINELNNTILQNQSRMYEIEIANNQAKLMALQSQINPHFLYNTLESIQGLTYLGKCDEIRTAISSLAFILRYSISGDDMVTVEKELQSVEKYLQIVELRFPKRFNIKVHIDDNILQCMMPRFLLQPLVENAISHGLEYRMTGGTLTFTGTLMDGGIIHFECSDNGKGIQPEKLERLKKMIQDISNDTDKASEKYSEGIGLSNIHLRLRLIYGMNYGLSILSNPMENTTVCVDFPAQFQDEKPIGDGRTTDC